MPAPAHTQAPADRDQSPERICGMFAAIAPGYDRLNHLLSGQLDRHWRRVAARAAVDGLKPCRRILDLATGTGDLANALARRGAANGDSPVVVGADFTGEMLRRGKKKYGTERFRWTEADGLNLPYADGAFDAATVAFGLRNMADKTRALAELTRVVRPGGRVVILEFGQPPNRLVRAGYDFYSYKVLPKVGAWLSGSDAYLYLADSIRGFWNAHELKRRMEAAGMGGVSFRRLMLGVVCLHFGEKADNGA